MADRKVCVITGANSGIGKAAAGQIAAAGYHVVMACRSAERGERAAAEIRSRLASASLEVAPVDMGLMASIRRLAAQVAARHAVVDVLIHNAAIFNVTQKAQEKTAEGIETVWSTNHLGPVLLTELLLPQISASANGRVITVSSKGLLSMPGLKVDLEDPELDHRRYSITRAYYQSKRAQVMYTRWLADRFAGTPMTANAVRVTAVRIDLDRHPDISSFQRWVYAMKSRMSLTPEEMAKTYTWLATSADVQDVSGGYFDEKNRQVGDVAYARDRGNIDAVMRLTARYVPELTESLRRAG